MYTELVMKANKNLQRVFTKTKGGLNDMNSAVAIVGRKSRTLRNGTRVLNLTFEDGNIVEVTYKSITNQ